MEFHCYAVLELGQIVWGGGGVKLYAEYLVFMFPRSYSINNATTIKVHMKPVCLFSIPTVFFAT